MSSRPLSSYKIIITDVYGTLIDWESGIYKGLAPIIPPSWSKKDALSAYAAVEKELQAQYPDVPYRDLLAKAYEILSRRLKASGGQLENADGARASTSEGGEQTNASNNTFAPGQKEFANSIKSWPIFPDTIPALHALSEHFKVVVLSNVDRESFSSTHTQLSQLEASKSQSPFNLVVTAQDAGVYKPSLSALRHALSILSASPEFNLNDVLVVAQSLYHDHIPANQLGLDSVWIDRKDAVMGVEDDVRRSANFGCKFAMLGDMVEAVKQELVV